MARLFVTMETMHAVGRRNLPPVPRAAADATTPVPASPAETGTAGTPAPADAVLAPDPDSSAGTVMPAPRAPADMEAPAQAESEPAVDAVAPGTLDVSGRMDAGQAFVARLRAAGAVFAEAAEASSAIVREVVPPARHRRSRCRVVFRYADGTEADLTFVGERRHPGTSDSETLGEEIVRWLSGGQVRDPAWLVPDPEAPDGVAVDVTAWLATG